MNRFLFYTLSFGLLTASLALAGGAGAPAGMAGGPPAGISTVLKANFADVAYANVSATQKLDLYLPAGNGPFPVVVYIHGGGFRLGDKSGASASKVQALLKAGYAVAPINYRLSGEALFPAAVQDSFAAVRYLRANAAKYHLNPAKFAAMGESAGGNLAALLGTAGDTSTFLDPKLGNAGVSGAVQAVVAQFPPIDFTVIDDELKAQGCSADQINHNTAQGFESLYFGAALPTVPQKSKAANPITYLTPKAPPTFLENGDMDCNVGSGQSKLLYDALQKAGVKSSYEQFGGAGHGGAVFDSAATVAKIVAFLNSALK